MSASSREPSGCHHDDDIDVKDAVDAGAVAGTGAIV